MVTLANWNNSSMVLVESRSVEENVWVEIYINCGRSAEPVYIYLR